ncbi:MAG: GNAT family N-acetyltransferase [Lentilitoribacter sp.]
MQISLCKITRENFDAVIGLSLRDDQKDVLPSNVFSIAESTLSPLFHPRAICQYDKVVGFAMYQFGEIGDFDEDDCTIWRFMIDHQHQNAGIGTAAMALVIEEIKTYKRAKMIDIYYHPDNIAAAKLYAKFGFKVVGDRDDGTLIAEIAI